MSGYVAVDLSKLPAPDVIEVLDFEIILAAMKADLLALAPELGPALEVESEPLLKVLQVCAYREVLLRARVNDGARAVMLATSSGADLENLGALLGVQRLTVTPADPEAIPPVAAVMERDDDLRRRIQLALEGFSTAGPRGAYLSHALSASGDVLDASVVSLVPGTVTVRVLSRSGDGAASPALISLVAAALNDDTVRPLCDSVDVLTAEILPYEVTAELVIGSGPDGAVARDAAEAATLAYVALQHRLGRAVRLSGLYAALHQPGVERVTLISPVADIEATVSQAAWCSAVSVSSAP